MNIIYFVNSQLQSTSFISCCFYTNRHAISKQRNSIFAINGSSVSQLLHTSSKETFLFGWKSANQVFVLEIRSTNIAETTLIDFRVANLESDDRTYRIDIVTLYLGHQK
ncbi:hypothetical protein K7432_001953 [Basidiobolus ranarum]|uniref:Uncharacterized protein n=1 Tax=Basidiobolus ranarum TaxID=34480 RepID=A0ABR2W8P0_9FUNG